MNHIQLSQSGNDSEVIASACQVLQSGGLVIYPTETIYGIAADATNPIAVENLLKFKNRPAGKAISILVSDREMAEKYVQINPIASSLYTSFLPGPLTIISKSLGKVDIRLESEFRTLGVRISSHPIAQKLVDTFGKPITATSANAAGKARPYSIEVALAGLTAKQKSLIGCILDSGTLPHREPSTVIDTTQEVQTVVRAGELFQDIIAPHHTFSEDETITLGQQFTNSILHQVRELPVIMALEGEMGAGKTQFAKGVARALSIQKVISSPTYTIMKEYEGVDADSGQHITFLHLDCWRLPSATLDELGISVLRPGQIILIEWAAPIIDELKTLKGQAKVYHVYLEAIDHERVISIRSFHEE